MCIMYTFLCTHHTHAHRLISLKKYILRPHEIIDQIDRALDKADSEASYSCQLPQSLLGGLLKRFVQEVVFRDGCGWE